jgi:hypothetical protein
MYQGQLSNYELSEVLDYPQIYYVGTGGQKVRNTSVNKVPLARSRFCGAAFLRLGAGEPRPILKTLRLH